MAEPARDVVRGLEQLRSAISGEVRHDRLSRALYATDASIYQIVPDGVALPKSPADVAAAVRICAEHGIPLTARGAGTGLTGGAVNRGIQLDCSRYLTGVSDIDPQRRTVHVQAGVVLDELNAQLSSYGLYFAPDVATSSRATVGGMIANNSCGARSVLVGRTVDHVVRLDAVLSDGSTCTWGPGATPHDNPLAQRCEETLAAVAREQADEISARFPNVLRRNGGYALDRLRTDNGRINAETIICGSEGTLAVVVGATLKLSPLPKKRGLVVVHFDDLLASLAAVPIILGHKPAAVELVDQMILDATRANPALARRRWFLDGAPTAILIVELFDDEDAAMARRLDALVTDLKGRRVGYAWPTIDEPARQADVWEVRKAGLGLLMSKPGDEQPHTCIEDAAVDPARLHDYIARLGQILAEEGVSQVGYYAHASVGLLHVRPVLNLKTRAGIERLRRISDRASSLALEFGGTFTGEHGDGIIRSAWLEKMYGPDIIAAFRRVKHTFDPHGTLNPGKIIDPLPMDANLRFETEPPPHEPATTLDFGAYGGMAGLAGMCNGVGQCRQRLVGTMCPSYMATHDETHTTRARANALRMALSNDGLLDGLSDPALDEVFDLCLSCKACQTECPTRIDIARLKAEWLAQRNERLGVPRRSRLIARSIELAAWGCRFAPLSNWLMQSRVVRAFVEHWYGLDRRVPPPRFAGQAFRQWFAQRRQPRAGDRPQVVYFVDTWVNYYTPGVGQAAVKVLEALGYEVVVPPTVCCGRPLISKGLLGEAKALAEANVAILAPFADRGLPIIGTEPSCIATLVDEQPQFVRTPAARRIAERAQTVETFVGQALEDNPGALRFKGNSPPLLYHGHCHQKALTGTGAALRVLGACVCGGATEIDSGCCGMAGSFGHEVEHYDVAKAIGEQRLFPAVRTRGEARIAVSGFSCRQQIEHHTDAQPRHVIEYVADALVDEDAQPAS